MITGIVIRLEHTRPHTLNELQSPGKVPFTNLYENGMSEISRRIRTVIKF